MKYFFDDIVSEVKTLNSLFLDVLDQHAPIKRIKIKSRSNPFVTPEIKQRMKTWNRWHSDLRQTTLEKDITSSDKKWNENFDFQTGEQFV